jgi:hypothetical protein
MQVHTGEMAAFLYHRVFQTTLPSGKHKLNYSTSIIMEKSYGSEESYTLDDLNGKVGIMIRPQFSPLPNRQMLPKLATASNEIKEKQETPFRPINAQDHNHHQKLHQTFYSRLETAPETNRRLKYTTVILTGILWPTQPHTSSPQAS